MAVTGYQWDQEVRMAQQGEQESAGFRKLRANSLDMISRWTQRCFLKSFQAAACQATLNDKFARGKYTESLIWYSKLITNLC